MPDWSNEGQFEDWLTAFIAAQGGGGGGVNLTSPGGTLSIGGTPTAPTADVSALVVTATSPLILPDAIQVFGHSYMSGAMTNNTINRQTAKLAKACKGAEANHGVAASVLSTHTNVGGLDVSTAPAGIVGVLQTVTAPRTPGTDMFLSGVECAVLCWGINDYALMGGTNFATIFPANLHTAIRRIRAGAIFEDTHASVTFPTGTWTPVTSTLVNSGAGAHFTASNAATVQIAVPSQYAGQPITLGFIDTGVVGTVTVTDETSANQGSITLGGFAYTENAKVRNGYPSIHIPGATLAAGAHTLTLTYSQTGGGNLFFDYWSIGADSTPPIIIELANRIPDYTKHAIGWPNAPINDAAITTMNTIMQTVAAAYTDGHVICVAVDDIIGNNAANLTSDGVHPNSGPAGLIAQRLLATLQQANQGRADILRLGTA
jgi:lysophospholipase L1-like esterase